MKISILMPTYKCPPDLLVKALNSVIQQRFTDWELVIKDGATENATENQAWHFAEVRDILNANQDRIKYVVGPESADRLNGQNSYYEALNWCIENSTGDILTVLAGDDERGDPSVLGHVNRVFENQDPGPFCLYGACEWINRDGDHVCFKRPPVLPVTFDEILRDFPFYTPAIFWNRAVHDKFGLFDNQYPWSADLDFWLKVWRGIESDFTPAVIGKYRQWETSQQRIHCLEAGQEATAVADKWRLIR